MGKPKTQRTQTLIQAARRYTVAKQVVRGIEAGIAQRAGKPDIDELLRKHFRCT